MCNLGFSIALFLLWFYSEPFLRCILFSVVSFAVKKYGTNYILIKTKIIVLSEYVVMKKPLEEYYLVL